MKKVLFSFLIFAILSVFCLSSVNASPPASPRQFNDITAAELVANIRVGWNLGNSFDPYNSPGHALGRMDSSTSLAVMEGWWGNPVTTRANITAIKNASFNAIRIPVSWAKAADSNHNIRADWMARITEVVNWAVENDMYIIINTHHDEELFRFTNAHRDASLRAFRRIWEQIAHNFRNYNEKLIFEGLNEPRTKGASHEWSGGNAAERANLNRHYQVFVDVVRASGGNNDKRILMINTYGASANAAAVNGLILPTDTVPNKLVVSIHAYEPSNFALNANNRFNSWDRNNTADTRAVQNAIDPAYNRFVRNGIPVIIGEFGSPNKNNTAARAAHAEYYVNYARSRGIPCFWWDNGPHEVVTSGEYGNFGILNRATNQIVFPEIVSALMRGIN
ncbi:MAG: glycoside hydrolase family 5 protein [Treponema sp.]|nr:glycoside hydrolase family 5 protein [Treponema sp.]